MEGLYKLVEVENATRHHCVSRLNILLGFMIGCLVCVSIITIIVCTRNDKHEGRPFGRINPLEPRDELIYVSWDSFNLPTFDDNSNNSVCFDYDDTIAFTTSAFEFAKNISGGSVDQMWDIVNNKDVGERLSMNKNITSLILRRYVSRAPSSPIRIITARCSPAPERIAHDEANIQQQIAKIIPEATNLEVYMACAKFSERMNKIKAMKYYGCRIMFGDSDDDMRSCILSGNCSPLRILRAPNSTYRSDNNPGLFHEPIVSNSEF